MGSEVIARDLGDVSVKNVEAYSSFRSFGISSF